MSKVVLHIGTHKTATTTIQDMFWANAELLAEHGLVYPRLSLVTGHHGLVYDWARLPKVYELPDGSLGTLAKIAEEYAEGEATVFLSSEEFSRGDPAAAVDFAAVREALKAFDEIEVICVLRSQWQFLQSVYLELSKKQIPPRPPQMVEPVIESGMFKGLWVDYNRLLDQLEEVFAPEEITLRDFESCRRAEGGVIGSLLRHLGINLTVDTLEEVNEGNSNVSPMSLASWSANIMAEPKVAPEWLVNKTTAMLKQEFGDDVKPCLFTRQEFSTLKAHFDARNEVLRQRRASVQPRFRLSQADAKGLTLFRNEVPPSFWVRVSRNLVRDRL